MCAASLFEDNSISFYLCIFCRHTCSCIVGHVVPIFFLPWPPDHTWNARAFDTSNTGSFHVGLNDGKLCRTLDKQDPEKEKYFEQKTGKISKLI